jgi:hypothetical protein
MKSSVRGLSMRRLSTFFSTLLTVSFYLFGPSHLMASEIQVYRSNGDISKIDSSLEDLSFGSDQLDGESVGKVIAFVNEHKSQLVGDATKSVGKLYFSPRFSDDSMAKVLVSNGSAALRFQQSFYFTNHKGEKVYVPFEGAEVLAYVDNLQGNILTRSTNTQINGNLKDINSSLIDSKSYEHFIERLPSIDADSFRNSSVEDRVRFLSVLKKIDSQILRSGMYPEKMFLNADNFSKAILEDRDCIAKFIRVNKDKAQLIFSKKEGSESSYEPVLRVSLPFDSTLIIDFRVDAPKGEVVGRVRSISKHVNVNIYTGTIRNLKKRRRASGVSSVAKDQEASGGLFRSKDYDIALINLSKVVEYFKETFSWNGFDNRGSDLNATVRYKGSKLFGTNSLRQNAAWVGAPYNQFLFGKGGDTLGGFLHAFDVIGHEYCHAIIAHTSGLDGGGQPGALNEHLCDILGVGFEGDLSGEGYDYKIGEKVVLKGDQGLRDFLNPDASFSDQPSHMKQVDAKFGPFCVPTQSNDECGVHYSNGVVNKAIGLSVQSLGWSRMKDLIFEVATKRLRSSSNFQDYKTQVLAACNQSDSFSENDCSVMEGHFASVGLSGRSIVDGDDSSATSTDFDAQLCSIVLDLCKVSQVTSSIGEMCKKCGHEF